MRLTLNAVSFAILLLFSSAAGATPPPPGETPTDAGLNFGAAVAFAGGDLLVSRLGLSPRRYAGPGGIHVFRSKTSGAWSEVAVMAPKDIATGDEFGASLAVDGSLLAVGAPGAALGQGAIYIFERDKEGHWTECAKLTATAGSPDDRLGEVVALGNGILLAGAPAHGDNRGLVVVFRRGADPKTWTEQHTLYAPDSLKQHRFGRSLAISNDRLLIGAPGFISPNHDQWQPGQVVIFRDSSQTWVEETRLTVSDDTTALGVGAALLVDGATLWVSAPNSAGAVYQFHRDAAGRWAKVGRIRAATAQPQALFGFGLARDGRDLVIGAAGTDQFTGAIYIMRYDSAAATWTETQHLTLAGGVPGLRFGEKIAAGGGIIVAGAAVADGGEGSAVLFHHDPTQREWQQIATVGDAALSVLRQPLTGRAMPCDSGRVKIFECQNTELLSFLPLSAIGGGNPGVRVSGIWGWTDSATGREFAIVGRTDGTSFIEVTDPVNPQYLGNLPVHQGAKPSLWHDMKVYKNHAFVVSDGAGPHGIQIFDLTQLRDVKNAPVTFQETAHYGRVNSVHTITVNEETGYIYPAGNGMGGETCGGGLHMVDVRNPEAPVFVGCYTEPKAGIGYIHDAQCVVYRGPDQEHQGREICLNSAESALGITDVTDKKQPKTLSVTRYPNVAYTHQGWLTEDQRYFFLDDEQDENVMAQEVGIDNVRTRTIVFDLNDLDDPVVLTEFYGTTNATDHNLYIRGQRMYQSNYEAGLRIIDIADPGHPKEIGYFDTAPAGSSGGGSWSNYPYFKNDVVGVTSIGQGFFLVRLRPR